MLEALRVLFNRHRGVIIFLQLKSRALLSTVPDQCLRMGKVVQVDLIVPVLEM